MAIPQSPLPPSGRDYRYHCLTSSVRRLGRAERHRFERITFHSDCVWAAASCHRTLPKSISNWRDLSAPPEYSLYYRTLLQPHTVFASVLRITFHSPRFRTCAMLMSHDPIQSPGGNETFLFHRSNCEFGVAV